MYGTRALLLLLSLAATSLLPPPGPFQEPAPPQRFPEVEIQPCAVESYRLVVYRGPRSNIAPGKHREFVLEQCGGLSFHARDEQQSVGSVSRMQAAHLDPLGLVLQHFGSLAGGTPLSTPSIHIRDLGPGAGLAGEEVLRVLLMTDGQVVFQMETPLVAPTSAQHAQDMASSVGLWDQLFAQVLEANQRRECKAPSNPYGIILEDQQKRWMEEAMRELELYLPAE